MRILFDWQYDLDMKLRRETITTNTKKQKKREKQEKCYAGIRCVIEK